MQAYKLIPCEVAVWTNDGLGKRRKSPAGLTTEPTAVTWMDEAAVTPPPGARISEAAFRAPMKDFPRSVD